MSCKKKLIGVLKSYSKEIVVAVVIAAAYLAAKGETTEPTIYSANPTYPTPQQEKQNETSGLSSLCQKVEMEVFLRSFHFDSRLRQVNNYNDNTTGVGLSCDQIHFGIYRNSYGRDSVYLQYEVLVLSIPTTSTSSFYVSLLGGFLTGYEKQSGRPIGAALRFVLSVPDGYSFSCLAIPPMNKKEYQHGVLSFVVSKEF